MKCVGKELRFGHPKILHCPTGPTKSDFQMLPTNCYLQIICQFCWACENRFQYFSKKLLIF